MKCKVCGANLKIITNSHLNKHNMSIKEYMTKFGRENWKGAMEGKTHSLETKNKMKKSHEKYRGENNPSKRPEVREKLSKALTGTKRPWAKESLPIKKGMTWEEALGEEKAKEMREQRSLAYRGKGNPNYGNPGHKLCGENNPSWKGGKNHGYGPNFNENRKQAFDTYGTYCQSCGKTDKVLDVHHRIPYRILPMNDVSNLMILCRSCHVKKERRDFPSKKRVFNVCFDLDGTLTIEDVVINYSNVSYKEMYRKRTPRTEAIQMLNKLSKECVITIWTSRYENDRKVTEEWLKEHNVQYDKLIMKKPCADVYIHADAINFEKFIKVCRHVQITKYLHKIWDSLEERRQ